MARPSARERLLDCAERLFAEHGVGGVSLRGINAEAGLSPAALHYHFGSKEALVQALLERRMSSLMDRRAELFDHIERGPLTPAPRDRLGGYAIDADRPQEESDYREKKQNQGDGASARHRAANDVSGVPRSEHRDAGVDPAHGLTQRGAPFQHAR